MSDTARTVYTVMADCGVGEFLWVKESTESCLVGSNVFSQMEKAEDQDLLSAGLFNKLWDWAGEFMAGQPKEWGLPWEVEWESFNVRGLELAHTLKEELGSSVDVQYVRPSEDPASEMGRLMWSSVCG